MSENHEDQTKELDQTEEKEDYAFLKETVKDEQITGRRIWSAILKQVGKGLVFGLAACVAFCVLKPWLEPVITGKNTTVTLPKDEETPNEDDEEKEEETETPEVVIPEFTIDNVKEQNKVLYEVVQNANGAIVDVEAVTEDGINGAAGFIAWENSIEYMVVIPEKITENASSLTAVLSDSSRAGATLKIKDKNLQLAVLSVAKQNVSENTQKQVHAATFGNSNICNRGDTVIVLGRQFGYANGLAYGTISSMRNKMKVPDGEIRLVETNVDSNSEGSAVLLNLAGEIIGLATPQTIGNNKTNLVGAFAISDIKEQMELLLNGKGVPFAGIYGTDITDSISQEKGIPKGIYVQEVIADSPAMQAGIQSGDVITAMNGDAVTTLRAFENDLLKLSVGQEVKIEGLRMGNSEYESFKFHVVIGSKE